MNGAVSFLNPVAESLTGWSLEDARGKAMDLVFDIVNKETRRPAENPVKKVFREGKVVGLAEHTILRAKSGKEFDIEDSAAPIVTDTGAGFGVVLVFRDITEKKLADEETSRQKDLLQLILEASQTASSWPTPMGSFCYSTRPQSDSSVLGLPTQVPTRGLINTAPFYLTV